MFDSTHDYYYALPATLVTAARDRSLAIADLPVEGSNRVVACDLNRDGFTDLVFMPNAQNLNVQDQRTSLTIAWGGQDGWTAAGAQRAD